MFTISIINRTGKLTTDELLPVIRAINRQIREDFEPYWGFGGQLRLEGAVGSAIDTSLAPADMRGDAVIYLCNNTTVKDALGYHESNLLGIPFGFVDLKLCEKLKEPWSVTLSHEALELLADPQGNLLVKGPHPSSADREVYHWFEVCDAVQGRKQAYLIDGVQVSNFVLPQYFTPGEQQGARNDFRGSQLKSFSVLPGGYIGFFDPALGKDSSVFGDRESERRQRIKLAGGLGRGARREAGGPEAVGRLAQEAGAAADPIEHVIVLMLENRSFDHLLGALPGVDGIDPQDPPVLKDAGGKPHRVNYTPLDDFFGFGKHFDFNHEHPAVVKQLGIVAGQPRMDGFLVCDPDYQSMSSAQLDQILAVFPDGNLGALHALAREFLVCDRWFSSLPGPTWPNRLFALSGTSGGDVSMPATALSTLKYLGRYNQDTIFDRLDAAGKSWRIYHHGVPNSIILTHQWKKLHNYSDIGNYSKDIAACSNPDDFPAFTWIEPDFFGIGSVENSQHPPSAVSAGEQLIADVYNALRTNDALWQKSLLVIYYDEHGGFYDHVPPGTTVAPDSYRETDFAFDRLGVRVPAVLVSPWVAQGVSSTVFDHTSLLRYLCEKWRMPTLGARTPAVHSIGSLIGGTARRVAPTPLQPRQQPGKAASAGAGELDAAREALLSFMEHLTGKADQAAAAGARAAAAAPAAPQTPAQRLAAVTRAFASMQAEAVRAAGKGQAKARKPVKKASSRKVAAEAGTAGKKRKR